MNRAFSVYLDMIRILAASIVMFGHYLTPLFNLPPGIFPGHDAVIMFFVLSGYVIAYITETRQTTARRYATARLARIWSVAVPALAVAAVACLAVGSRPVPNILPIAKVSEFVLRGLVNLLFLGESWFGDIEAPFDGAMWSLNYEAWYYLIFGAWTFTRRNLRVPATIFLLVLAGPKISALMPCWLMGVFLYRCRDHLTLKPGPARGLFVFSLVAYATTYELNISDVARQWLSWITNGASWHLGPSTSLLGDLILVTIFALNFVSAWSLPTLGTFLLRFKPAISYTASFTLSFYLYHMPLFAIIYAGFGLGPPTGWLAALSPLAVIPIILLLGWFTERRRLAWRDALERIV